MDKRLFQIGEAARMYRVSVRTLRHYEQAGLLAPEYVDPDTGYRYYSLRQFEVLNTIRYLRAHELRPADFSREITLIDDGMTRDTGKFVTEISVPVCNA